MLAEIRAVAGLVERTPGCFYRKGAAYLHFHEAPAGVFADARLHGPQFDRLRVSTGEEQAEFLAALRAALLRA